MIRRLTSRAARRLAFAIYALTIAVLTHWPEVSVQGPTARPDLLIHLGVFAIWTALAIASEIAGPWDRGRAIAIAMVGAAAYAALDEATQQWVGRVSSWQDFGANVLGVAIGGVGVAAAAGIRGATRTGGTSNGHSA